MKNLLRYLCVFVCGGMLCYGCGQDDLKECTGGDCLIFEGVITDTNNEILSMTDITLVYDEASLGIFLDDREVIGRDRTNENGAYKISIDGGHYEDEEGYFDIKASKPGYIERSIAIFDTDSINLDTPTPINIELASEAFVEIEFETGPYVIELEYNLKVDYTSTFYTINESANLDTTYTYRVAGDRFVPIYYAYKKFGERVNGSDSIFIDQGLSKRIKIEID